MSIQNALIFIKKVRTDDVYRKKLYKYSSRKELLVALSSEGSEFTNTEFDEAINIEHVKCQTYEEADNLKQIEWWFSLFK